MPEEPEIVCSTQPVDRYIQSVLDRTPEALREEYLVIMKRLGRAATLLAEAEANDKGCGKGYGIASDNYNAALVARVVFGEKLAGLQYS